ncbi:hypothetical protein RSJ21_05025 [Clostridium botulinum]|nr:hypothetical protein RSJ6_04580 [Clostridium botulinum]AUN20848.1 hypothetical protein RSJ22_05160 [Clostridium botulinum]AUN24632.1 hypothetical protein RSJ21_05025 [Clostridium botulinum]OSA72957.1 hypothetical protein B2H87_02250 [Clostridium botulinum]QDY20258.1 CPBP family intramembrane metalloprotease [Clostridium botulinum]
MAMATFDEVIFRGLMLNGLMELTKNKHIAVLLSAVVFGMDHAGNIHATAILIISNSLGEVMYSIAYLKSKSLYFTIVLYFSWDFFKNLYWGFL